MIECIICGEKIGTSEKVIVCDDCGENVCSSCFNPKINACVDCSENYVLIRGSKADQTKFFEYTDLSCHELDLSNCNLLEFEIETRESFSNLDYVNLSGNSLKKLDLSLFAECESLEKLDLSFNRFTHLNLKPLQECAYLEYLDLSGNDLRDLDLGLPKRIVRLNISQNKLIEADLDPLRNCTYLRIADLSHNSLRFLDLSPLEECRWLEVLSVQNNPLQGLDLSPLENSANLKTIAIDENVLLFAHAKTPPFMPLGIYMVKDRIYAWVSKGKRITQRPLHYYLSEDFQEQFDSFVEQLRNTQELKENITHSQLIIEKLTEISEPIEEQEKVVSQALEDFVFEGGEEKAVELHLIIRNNMDKEGRFKIRINSPFPIPLLESPFIQIKAKDVKKCGPFVLGRPEWASPSVPIAIMLVDENENMVQSGAIYVSVTRSLRKLTTKIIRSSFGFMKHLL